MTEKTTAARVCELPAQQKRNPHVMVWVAGAWLLAVRSLIALAAMPYGARLAWLCKRLDAIESFADFQILSTLHSRVGWKLDQSMIKILDRKLNAGGISWDPALSFGVPAWATDRRALSECISSHPVEGWMEMPLVALLEAFALTSGGWETSTWISSIHGPSAPWRATAGMGKRFPALPRRWGGTRHSLERDVWRVIASDGDQIPAAEESGSPADPIEVWGSRPTPPVVVGAIPADADQRFAVEIDPNHVSKLAFPHDHRAEKIIVGVAAAPDSATRRVTMTGGKTHRWDEVRLPKPHTTVQIGGMEAPADLRLCAVGGITPILVSEADHFRGQDDPPPSVSTSFEVLAEGADGIWMRHKGGAQINWTWDPEGITKPGFGFGFSFCAEDEGDSWTDTAGGWAPQISIQIDGEGDPVDYTEVSSADDEIIKEALSARLDRRWAPVVEARNAVGHSVRDAERRTPFGHQLPEWRERDMSELRTHVASGDIPRATAAAGKLAAHVAWVDEELDSLDSTVGRIESLRDNAADDRFVDEAVSKVMEIRGWFADLRADAKAAADEAKALTAPPPPPPAPAPAAKKKPQPAPQPAPADDVMAALLSRFGGKKQR